MDRQKFESSARDFKEALTEFTDSIKTNIEKNGTPEMAKRFQEGLDQSTADVRMAGLKAMSIKDPAEKYGAIADLAQKGVGDVQKLIEADPALKELLEKQQGKLSMSTFNLRRGDVVTTERNALYIDPQDNAYSVDPAKLPQGVEFAEGKQVQLPDYKFKLQVLEDRVENLKKSAQEFSPLSAPASNLLGGSGLSMSNTPAPLSGNENLQRVDAESGASISNSPAVVSPSAQPDQAVIQPRLNRP